MVQMASLCPIANSRLKLGGGGGGGGLNKVCSLGADYCVELVSLTPLLLHVSKILPMDI